MNAETIAALRAALSAATPLPWAGGYPKKAEDWHLAALAVSALPALLAEIERQREVIGRVNAKCDHLGIRLGEVIAERDALQTDARRPDDPKAQEETT